MSALGQKQTFAMQEGMSALPLKADMCSALAHVRFVPQADITPYSITLSARPSSESGTLSPSAFAAFDLWSETVKLRDQGAYPFRSVLGVHVLKIEG
jgi:hypothetical protein